MVARTHLRQNEIAQRALGQQAGKPGRERAMETDLVASGCQVLPRGIIIKGVMPPERQDRSGGILNVGFGHGERDSAAGVSRERSDMCWSTQIGRASCWDRVCQDG